MTELIITPTNRDQAIQERIPSENVTPIGWTLNPIMWVRAIRNYFVIKNIKKAVDLIIVNNKFKHLPELINQALIHPNLESLTTKAHDQAQYFTDLELQLVLRIPRAYQIILDNQGISLEQLRGGSVLESAEEKWIEVKKEAEEMANEQYQNRKIASARRSLLEMGLTENEIVASIRKKIGLDAGLSDQEEKTHAITQEERFVASIQLVTQFENERAEAAKILSPLLSQLTQRRVAALQSILQDPKQPLSAHQHDLLNQCAQFYFILSVPHTRSLLKDHHRALLAALAANNEWKKNHLLQPLFEEALRHIPENLDWNVHRTALNDDIDNPNSQKSSVQTIKQQDYRILNQFETDFHHRITAGRVTLINKSGERCTISIDQTSQTSSEDFYNNLCPALNGFFVEMEQDSNKRQRLFLQGQYLLSQDTQSAILDPLIKAVSDQFTDIEKPVSITKSDKAFPEVEIHQTDDKTIEFRIKIFGIIAVEEKYLLTHPTLTCKLVLTKGSDGNWTLQQPEVVKEESSMQLGESVLESLRHDEEMQDLQTILSTWNNRKVTALERYLRAPRPRHLSLEHQQQLLQLAEHLKLLNRAMYNKELKQFLQPHHLRLIQLCNTCGLNLF